MANVITIYTDPWSRCNPFCGTRKYSQNVWDSDGSCGVFVFKYIKKTL